MKTARLLCAAFVMLIMHADLAMAQRGGPQGPTGVFAAPVKRMKFSDKVEALGTVKAFESVIITSPTAEKIVDIHFEDGGQVMQGEVLVTLEKEEEEAALSAAQAQTEEARAALERAQGLQKSSALSKATLQEREAALKEQEAGLEEIRARIDNRTITAPFDGVLGLREVSVGTLVQPGDQITTIDALDRVKVDFDVPSVFLANLKPGLPVIGEVEAYVGRSFAGEVATVNTQVDPVTRTVRVRAVMQNPDHVLKPGLLMSIALEKNPRSALVIPEEAIIKRGEKDYVYIIEESGEEQKAIQTEIQIGGRQPGLIEVVSGLSEGDQIVSHGLVKVSDGASVNVRAVESEDQSLDELLEQEPASGGGAENLTRKDESP